MSSEVSDRTGLADPVAGTARTGRGGRSWRRIMLIFLCLLAMLAIGTYADRWWQVGRFVVTTDDAFVGGNVTSLAAHVSGFVASIPVGDNDFARRGTVVLRLDSHDLTVKATRANAMVAQAQAAIETVQARLVAQRAVIAEARAKVAAKLAAAQFAGATAARYRHLAGGGAASSQDIQRADAGDAMATAGMRAAEAGLASARQRRAVLRADIVAAKAGLQAASADAQVARIALSYATVTAPISGYVADRYAERGAFVAAGTPLLSIVPACGLWVDANVKEDDLAGIKPGDPATIRADAVPGHVFHGHVISVAPATGAIFSVIPPQNATGNFTKTVQRVPVRIMLDGDGGRLGRLRPGLSATVSIDTKQPHDAAQ